MGDTQLWTVWQSGGLGTLTHFQDIFFSEKYNYPYMFSGTCSGILLQIWFDILADIW